MNKNDLLMVALIGALVMLFMPVPYLSGFQSGFLFNSDLWLVTSFLKFGILATLGEAIGLRIKSGQYHYPGFGLIPRSLVWGMLGIGIKMAFVIFATGTPVLVEKYFHLQGAISSMGMSDIFVARDNGLGLTRLLTAFAISTFMNLIFAPVFMTLHKITDLHILRTGGTLSGFFSPLPFGEIIRDLDWKVQWEFVFRKTIPFFWIPAHTVTFMMPPEYRIVFAAVLGIVLGVLLTVASGSKR